MNALGIVWNHTDDAWCEGYEHAEMYFSEHGDIDVPKKYVCDDGYTLGDWLVTQRRAYRNGKLSAKRASLLDRLGIVRNMNSDQWVNGYTHAVEYRTGVLESDKIEKLAGIGVAFGA